MGPHAKWAYKHRGRVGAPWETEAQCRTVGLIGLAGAHRGTTGTQGAQAPPRPHRGGGRPGATQRHPAGLTGAHLHTPRRGTGHRHTITETCSHRDTQPQRHTATETQGHRDTGTQGAQGHRGTETQRHRDTETQRHRDTETQRQTQTVGRWGGSVPVCHAHIDGCQ